MTTEDKNKIRMLAEEIVELYLSYVPIENREKILDDQMFKAHVNAQRIIAHLYK